jgi:hypothetical protein
MPSNFLHIYTCTPVHLATNTTIHRQDIYDDGFIVLDPETPGPLRQGYDDYHGHL